MDTFKVVLRNYEKPEYVHADKFEIIDDKNRGKIYLFIDSQGKEIAFFHFFSVVGINKIDE
jgi:hypothetical protein